MAWEEMMTQEVMGRERHQRHEGTRPKQDREMTRTWKEMSITPCDSCNNFTETMAMHIGGL